MFQFVSWLELLFILLIIVISWLFVSSSPVTIKPTKPMDQSESKKSRIEDSLNLTRRKRFCCSLCNNCYHPRPRPRPRPRLRPQYRQLPPIFIPYSQNFPTTRRPVPLFTFPSIPNLPTLPSLPSIPTFPSLPRWPSLPPIPRYTFPKIPRFPPIPAFPRLPAPPLPPLAPPAPPAPPIPPLAPPAPPAPPIPG